MTLRCQNAERAVLLLLFWFVSEVTLAMDGPLFEEITASLSLA